MNGFRGRSTRARRPSRRLCLAALSLTVVLAAVLAIVFGTVGLASTGTTTSGEVATAATQSTLASPTTLPPTSTTATPAIPAPVLAPASAGTQVEYSAEELEFVRLLNEYRVGNGLEPLLLSDSLTMACERHTSDMITYGFLNHFTGYYRASNGRDEALEGTRSDYFDTGADPGDRMAACGYDYRTVKGENLAAGQSTAAEALQTLKDSPTHNANLLHPDFRVIGIEAVHASGSEWGHYWTTDFGGYVDASAHAAATVVASVD